MCNKTYAARTRFQVRRGRGNQNASTILPATELEKDRTTTEVEKEFGNNHPLTSILCRSSSLCCRLSSDNKNLSVVTCSRSLIWFAIALNYKKNKTTKLEHTKLSSTVIQRKVIQHGGPAIGHLHDDVILLPRPECR